MATVGALGSLGADLAFSVSLGIAHELLDAATEAHLTEDELIAIVLAVSVLLAALPSTFNALRAQYVEIMRACSNSGNDRSKEKSGDMTGGAPKKDAIEPSGIMEFIELLVRMSQRISLSICVQLVASNVRSRQPLRSVRVVSLLAVAIFFLFLESTSSVGNARR